jgi:hypothetical protein
MAVQPKPGECVYANTNENEWRFFLSYQDGQYHTVDVSRTYDCVSYSWKVASSLQVSAFVSIRPRRISGLTSRVVLTYSTAIPAISWDENGAASADVGQLEALHLHPDVISVSWTDGPGGYVVHGRHQHHMG